MSWSFTAEGTPDEVLTQLETQNTGLTDHSKEEWDDAKPALTALVAANVGTRITIAANGWGSFDHDGHKYAGACAVHLRAATGASS
jgi:hypothetical protein